MRVLGIDPGYDRMGVAIVEGPPGKEQRIYSACLLTERTDDIASRLGALGSQLRETLDTHRPDVIAIETLYFNQNRTTAIAVAEARGVALYLAADRNLPVLEFTPQQVKVAVTGHGQSDKKQVAAMVCRLIPELPRDLIDDEYDAIAIAITGITSGRSRLSTP